MNMSMRIIFLAVLVGLGATGCWMRDLSRNWAQSLAPLQATSTPTAIPTSEPPYDPPTISAPADGAVIDGGFPDFQIGSPARAWTIHIVIFNDAGYHQEVIKGVGAGMSGWMNTMYTPAPPAPLPPGTYQWYAVGCRETAAGGCGPRSETRTFTISDP